MTNTDKRRVEDIRREDWSGEMYQALCEARMERDGPRQPSYTSCASIRRLADEVLRLRHLLDEARADAYDEVAEQFRVLGAIGHAECIQSTEADEREASIYRAMEKQFHRWSRQARGEKW